jgi:Myb-like DNA-binding protein FlbD
VKMHGLATSPPMYRSEKQLLMASPQEYHFNSRAQLPTAPTTPVQLPPLQLSARTERREQSAERDSRMHLSSLLG